MAIEKENTMSIVELCNVSYSYPSTNAFALADVNLTINEGEFLILTGPSGCGKTTLCRCLNGLIPHFYRGELTGNVVVNGLSTEAYPISELAQNVGFVFQNPENQLFALSVEKDIAFGLENLAIPRDEIRDNVEWAMDVTGISHLRDRAPYELSGGQQQRVAIASILAMKPKILVLDEPTSFLDPLASKTLFEVIRNLNQKLRLTIILVDHRLDLLVTYATRIVIMDKGGIMADGPLRTILNLPELKSLGIGLPKVVQLYQMLQANGVTLSKIPISVEEFVSEFREMLKK
jgi:energy-coupling factor transporter ATP-binding protein EcfA2